jgi:hypothetical protein
MERETTIDEAMKYYLIGKTVVFRNEDVGCQVFNRKYGEQTFLDFTIEEIAKGKWYLIAE